jgi:hypothetical protein
VKLRTRLRWFGLALAAAQALVGIVIAFVPNLEGPLGGLLYGLMYAVPTAAVALAWGSTSRPVQTVGGWAALLLAVFYTAIPVLNWNGYTPLETVFVLGVTVPTVLFDLAVFSALITGGSPGRAAA